MQVERGIIICAFHSERYLREAVECAKSIRFYCDPVHICLFTNLGVSAVGEYACFDSVRAMPLSGQEASWAGGLLARIVSLRLSPFAYTISLDADMRVMSAAFQGLVDARSPPSLRITEARQGESFDRRHCSAPIYSAALLAYDQCGAMKQLLQAWEDITKRNLRGGSLANLEAVCGVSLAANPELARRLAKSDQISLAELLRPGVSYADLSVELLSPSFNVKRLSSDGTLLEDTIVLHLTRKYRDMMNSEHSRKGLFISNER